MIRRPPRSTLFPYTRSSDLSRSLQRSEYRRIPAQAADASGRSDSSSARNRDVRQLDSGGNGGDRKSTRLNSSHMSISYAVFCLKKKKKKIKTTTKITYKKK